MAEVERFDPASLMKSGERMSELFEVDGHAAVDAIRGDSSLAPAGPPYSIQVVPVHTFILQGISKDVKLSRGILVPSFASHWGVVTGDPGALTLYHLVFVPDSRPAQDERPDTIRGRRRAIQFNHTPWPPSGREPSGSERMTKVGETRYSHEDRIKIGIIFLPLSFFESTLLLF
jgi:hypothetical protein